MPNPVLDPLPDSLVDALEVLPRDALAALREELIAERAHPRRLTEMQRVLGERTRWLSVVLEDIYQPHNSSAVLRTCECFGVQTVHVIEMERKFKVSNQVAMGGAKWIDLERHADTTTCLDQLRAGGYRLAAATLREDAIPLDAIPLDKPLAVLIGHERKGLTEEAHAEADIWFRLPIHGFTQSYNLSVFSSLCLYELTQRLRASTLPWRLSDEEQERTLTRWLCQDAKSVQYTAQGWLRKHS
ncbi:TrmH family RNA methyltransferase [Cerasicoccus arenae]|uniref:tRNA (guanosine(18)-2'-O)-methyltransferase n=1 Tax=Cerasicoccus arenae TaxID=424488 RepID=A0A8J3DEK6_9BACT|nr:RNA methyltransferase [Cerasicoccus arenae]MBK1856868.1 RNA methyltransferase [Cerasicoccus arenae]GHC11388.1 tRNA (guanosine(18)-2'-O)-methyltransferase [Cerasicoccus arenae]